MGAVRRSNAVYRGSDDTSLPTDDKMPTHLPSQLVDQHLHSIPSGIRWQIDSRTEKAAIFCILKLDDDVWDISWSWCFDMLGWIEVELLTLGRREESCHDEWKMDGIGLDGEDVETK